MLKQHTTSVMGCQDVKWDVWIADSYLDDRVIDHELFHSNTVATCGVLL